MPPFTILRETGGKARLTLPITMVSGGKPAVEFTGTFVALRQPTSTRNPAP